MTDPQNPLLALPGKTSVRFTPFVLLWGTVARILNLSTFELLPLVAAANLLLFLTGLWRFVAGHFNSRILPVVLLASLLLMWGKGYGQSNAYHLRMWFYTAPYLAIFAYGLSFHALAYLDDYLRSHKRLPLILYAALSVLTFLCHPITAMFLAVAAGTLAYAAGDFKRTLLLQSVLLLSIVAAIIWPYFDYWTVLTKGSTEYWFEVSRTAGHLAAYGPSLAGLAAVVYFAYKRQHLFIVYGTTACLLIYALSSQLEIFIGSRFTVFAAIFFHLAFAVFIVEHWQDWYGSLKARRLSAILLAVLALVLLFWAGRYRQQDIRRVSSAIWGLHSVGTDAYGEDVRNFLFMEDALTETDVVLAPCEYGLIIPAISGGKVASHIHGSPLINEELNQRCYDVDQFYREMEAEERKELIERYAITHVLIGIDPNPDAKSLGTGLQDLNLPILKGEKFGLIKLE